MRAALEDGTSLQVARCTADHDAPGLCEHASTLITYAREAGSGARRVLATSRGPACANAVYHKYRPRNH